MVNFEVEAVIIWVSDRVLCALVLRWVEVWMVVQSSR
jgi:hypothetical protein